LRHCAASRKVAGSIPDGVIGSFQWHNPSGRTMALGFTQLLTEMITMNICWGKDGRCVGLTPYHLHVPVVLKSGSPSLLEPSGPVQTCNGIALPLRKTSRRVLGPTVPPVQWVPRVLVPGVKRQKVHCSSFCLVRNITHFIMQYCEWSPVSILESL
jgi:hypothetical protein